MAQSVDTKIVELKFENNNFKDKVNSTLEKLDQLQKEIEEVGLAEALKGITKSAKDVDVSNISNGIDEAKKGFGKFEIFAVTAMANISNSIVNTGKKLVKNLIAPLTTQGLARAKNLELAYFQFGGLDIVDGYEHVMNAVTGTAYRYDSAAKAASQFAASGVGVTDVMKKLASGTEIAAKTMNKDMEKALLGVAGVAAMTGKDFDDIARVFTKVAGQNRVMADDLNSIAARGLNAKAVLAEYYGLVEDGETKVAEKIRKGEVSFKDFAEAMYKAYGDHAKDANEMFEGAYANMQAAMAKIGADFYTPALKYGRDLANSMSPLINTIHSVLNPALQESGNIMEKLSYKARGVLDFLAYNIELNRKGGDISDWTRKNMGSYMHLMDIYNKNSSAVYDAIDGFTKYSKSIKGVNKEIKSFTMIADYLGIEVDDVKKGVKEGTIGFYDFYKAFRHLYSKDPSLASNKGLSDAFNDYIIKAAEATGKTEEFIAHQRTFKSVIDGTKTIFGAFGTVLGSAARIVMTLAEHLKPLGKILVEIAKDIGKTSVKLADYIANSKTLSAVVDGVVGALTKFFELLQINTWASKALNAIGNAFGFLVKMVEKIDQGLSDLVGAFNRVFGRIFESIRKVLGDAEQVKQIIQSLKSAGLIVLAVRFVNGLMKPADMLETIAKALKDTGNSIKTIFDNIGSAFKSIADMFGKIGGVLDEVRIGLQKWQKVLMAATLVEIGLAILVIAGALYALSKIDAPKIAVPLGVVVAIAGMYLKMSKELSMLQQKLKFWEKKDNTIKDSATAMLEMAAAVAIIAFAIARLAKLDMTSLAAGTTAIILVMGTLTLMAKLLSGESTTKFSLFKGFERTSKEVTQGLKGLLYMAIAVRIVAGAVKSLTDVATPEDLYSAFGVIEALLVTMAGITKWLSGEETTKLTKGLTGLIAMSIAVRLLAQPIADLAMLASMDPGALLMASAIIGAFMLVMAELIKGLAATEGKSSPIAAALGILILAKAMEVLGEVITTVSALPVDTLFTSIAAISLALIVMAGSLVVLSKQEKGILSSSIAIYVLAKALNVIANACIRLGKNIDTAAQGLYLLAGALSGIMLAAALMKKVPLYGIIKLVAVLAILIAAMMGFGIAIGVISVGLAMLGMAFVSLANGAAAMQAVAAPLAIALGALAVAIAGFALLFSNPAFATGGLIFAGIILTIAAAFTMLSNAFVNMSTSMSVIVSLDDKFESVSKSIRSFVKALKENAGDVKDVGKAYGELEEPLTKIADAFTTLDTKLSTIKESMKELLSSLSDSLSTIATSTDQLSKMSETSLDNAANAITNFINTLTSTKDNIKNLSDTATAIKDSVGVVETTIEELKRKFIELDTQTKTSLDSVAEHLSAISTPITSLVEVKDKVGDVKTKLKEFMDSVVGMEDQISSFNGTADNLKLGFEKIEEPIKTLNDVMQKFHWSYGDSLQHIGDGASSLNRAFTMIINNKDDLPKAGDIIAKFFSKLAGVSKDAELSKSNTNSVANAVKKLGDNAKKAIKQLDTKEMTTGGNKIAKAIAKGINDSNHVNQAINKAIDKIKKKQDSFKSAGEYLVKGLISGINKQLPALEDAVVALEAKAERAVEAKAKIESPSKVWMKIGAYMGEGLAIGIRNSGERVAMEAEGLGKTSEDAIRAAIMSISDDLNSDMDLQPVITPIVDLSNVDGSIRSINSKFGSAGLSASLANSISSNGIQNGSNTSAINKLTKTLSSMTESMNSRSLNNYITVDGATDPTAFADGLLQEFRLNARTV